MSDALLPARRTRRNPPAQVGNVVFLHPAKEAEQDIIRCLQKRNRQRESQIAAGLSPAVATLDGRHREYAQECAALGYAMCRSTLDDWIEIGERMLAAQGRRA